MYRLTTALPSADAEAGHRVATRGTEVSTRPIIDHHLRILFNFTAKTFHGSTFRLDK